MTDQRNNEVVVHRDVSAFERLAQNITECLYRSDVKRKAGNDGASTGWTSWVDDAASNGLQSCMDKLVLSKPKNPRDASNVDILEIRDERLRWLQFFKACPTPFFVDLSRELRNAMNSTIDDRMLKIIDSDREAFLDRVGCRLILLPSGTELHQTLCTPPGSMAHGKLLFGGVNRYRLLGSGQKKRRAGERTEIYEKDCKSWLQYGGPERNYEAVDIGPCGLVEVVLLPQGLSLSSNDNVEMSLSNIDPNSMFEFLLDFQIPVGAESPGNDTAQDRNFRVFFESNHVDALESTFTSKVGGLQPQIEAIIRRVLDGRLLIPAMEAHKSIGHNNRNYQKRRREAETLSALGLKPVRGLLLYGAPGCGKTALAREISWRLNCRAPKVVAAPELLDRWVGGSELLVRNLFADAESELELCNQDPTKSALHVIIIDEIDAVFRRRTSSEDSGLAARDSCVNQILSKLDGVNALGNVLLVGMTNRKELLDPALLRPGRLEVQIEISKPDRNGRREILQIHVEALRRKGRLSKPLIKAIDGGLTGSRPWQALLSFGRGRRVIGDLADEKWTGGFSGADIAGLVRCAGSIALARTRLNGDGVDNLLITLEDVSDAIHELKK